VTLRPELELTDPLLPVPPPVLPPEREPPALPPELEPPPLPPELEPPDPLPVLPPELGVVASLGLVIPPSVLVPELADWPQLTANAASKSQRSGGLRSLGARYCIATTP
jgi:hypothetical protein